MATRAHATEQNPLNKIENAKQVFQAKKIHGFLGIRVTDRFQRAKL